MRVALLAGGTGGALLAQGLDELLEPGDLTVITNTGDDEEFHGLLVCPDSDAVMYRLAGLFNEETGWGVQGETFAAQAMLRRYGADGWFGLGDRDLATHLLRADLMRGGARLSEATLELCRRLGLRSRVVPVTDDRLRTFFVTDRGRLSFQEYFVRERLSPQLLDVEFEGAGAAVVSGAALQAVREAEAIVIGPSNPLISTGPILRVLGAEIVRSRTLAVSPIVAGAALKGPTVEMLRLLGVDPTAAGVARAYRERAAIFMIDARDAALRAEVEALEYRVLVADTLMQDAAGRRRVAGAVLQAFE